jgi:hypothetical protein
VRAHLQRAAQALAADSVEPLCLLKGFEAKIEWVRSPLKRFYVRRFPVSVFRCERVCLATLAGASFIAVRIHTLGNKRIRHRA